MTDAEKPKYQCDHSPELKCKANYYELEMLRHDNQKLLQHRKKLLEFVKWCKETASCHACEHTSMLAEKVLKELGEL